MTPPPDPSPKPPAPGTGPSPEPGEQPTPAPLLADAGRPASAPPADPTPAPPSTAAERPTLAPPSSAAERPTPAPPSADAGRPAPPQPSADVERPAHAQPFAAAERPKPAPPFADAERAAVYRAIAERRDVRNGFVGDPVDDAALVRVLEAAHRAPSVGLTQPWDFLIIRDPARRKRVRGLAERQRDAYAASLTWPRAARFDRLKIEAIVEAPINIAVTCDPSRGGRNPLGRRSQPQTAPYSVACAVENLWLAARAEGLGVGWVSFFDERELAAELGLPAHLEVVAYLCLGHVREFATAPELALSGWARRRPLAWAVHDETYGRRHLPGEAPVNLIEQTIAAIQPLDEAAMRDARDHQARLTKPPGALGVLEEVSVQLAGLAAISPPPLPEPAAVAIFAADHGVHAQGVTPWPQEVTAQMVANFLAGGAVVNAFAGQVGAEVTVVDIGVASPLPEAPGLLPRKVAPGTADMTEGPAMTAEQARQAVETGIEVARDLVSAGARCLITGDMGIANTTASAALISAFTGLPPERVTGRGTGIDDATHAHKIDIVRTALHRNALLPEGGRGPMEVLAGVGGLEHAALAGFILGGAALRVPVVLDGVIAGAAALVAAALCPDALGACVAGHRSAEPGHAAAVEHLGLRPLVDLELRLGEGTGALLALPLVQGAVRVLHEVATFDSAGVSGKQEGPE
ncbi:nicotinate-nucleotide--dimethylbenzimidazole phosphoribosyltransferase [Actinomadura barringtoniae]|uniref:Nicotinate-nucleotide--dimethylbenzimidazole phosphoribosyltransferase n=2 Tax=Actinomadura barringtoniae TaxID=1427535 RepID=A0A939T217_9ACTN|nr:nicotinate-nucleotide--dimethylbenzimidazole phosphoribosyltransferase [Actinomadura barringtoniae]MBO2445793.1 nicotinate-nucleotide--dimethylbenzimidazole phosphoribosyltransferase [Actinomadura barringtoniae]